MGESPSASEAQGQHLSLYDGVCGLCNRLLQFVLARDRRAVFDFASLQGATGRALVDRAGGNADELNALYVFTHYRTPAARVLTARAENTSSLDLQFGPATWVLSNGRTVSNPLGTTVRFAYATPRRGAASGSTYGPDGTFRGQNRQAARTAQLWLQFEF